MPGSLVEYARFVEVQQRRARIVTELERLPATPAAPDSDRADTIGGHVQVCDVPPKESPPRIIGVSPPLS
jgi:hypothetical protein